MWKFANSLVPTIQIIKVKCNGDVPESVCAPPARASVWDKYVDLNGAMQKFATSDMNIPEFIRVLEEESAIKIKDAMNKQ